MDATFDTVETGSQPELTPLGKRIELLRIERGLSKQVLARRAGTSRQQLWRVMTGKSELTTTLCHRLADVLRVDPRAIRSAEEGDGAGAPVVETFGGRAPASIEDYLSAATPLRATLRSLPAGDLGRQLKRDLLDAIEERVHARGLRLPPHFFELRAEVINGDL